MFDCTTESLENGQIEKYSLTENGAGLSYLRILELWQTDASFRRYFVSLLKDSKFAAYRWETPALSSETGSRPFEFILLEAPRFTTRKTDQQTYREYFTAEDADEGVVSFNNLARDATLIAPSPRTDLNAYGHLAAFVRNAPAAQVDALWRVVGNTAASQISSSPLWLSTAGGGVAWLHVRLDASPKYYGFAPYRKRY